jgi:hypothetical protein
VGTHFGAEMAHRDKNYHVEEIEPTSRKNVSNTDGSDEKSFLKMCSFEYGPECQQ